MECQERVFGFRRKLSLMENWKESGMSSRRIHMMMLLIIQWEGSSGKTLRFLLNAVTRKAEAEEMQKTPWRMTIRTSCWPIILAHVWVKQAMHGTSATLGFLLGHLVTWFNGRSFQSFWNKNKKYVLSVCSSASLELGLISVDHFVTKRKPLRLSNTTTLGKVKRNEVILRDYFLESLPTSSSHWRKR